MNVKRIAALGVLLSLAFVLSYVEYLLPLSIGIPGAKIGLANLVVVVAIFLLGERDAFVLSIIRVVLTALTFSNVGMAIYSIAGALASFGAMAIAKRSKKLSVAGVSITGGVFHNIGQIAVAMVLLETRYIVYYLPFLIVIGTVSGTVIGIISALIIKHIRGSHEIH